MRPILYVFLLSTLVLVLVSCGGKDKNSSDTKSNTAGDSVVMDAKESSKVATEAADSSLASLRSFIEKELVPWRLTFSNFSVDSFRLSQKTDFGNEYYQETTGLKAFYALYKASLNFSPDSNQFIDLHSSGIMLEKKGKKIIASGDVDQAVTVCNLKTREWKRIAFFGPSAWIEEAVWISPSTFLLAGIVVNDDGNKEAIIMHGDTNSRTFRWFESNTVRTQSVDYESSGIGRLKIDEWE